MEAKRAIYHLDLSTQAYRLKELQVVPRITEDEGGKGEEKTTSRQIYLTQTDTQSEGDP